MEVSPYLTQVWSSLTTKTQSLKESLPTKVTFMEAPFQHYLVQVSNKKQPAMWQSGMELSLRTWLMWLTSLILKSTSLHHHPTSLREQLSPSLWMANNSSMTKYSIWMIRVMSSLTSKTLMCQIILPKLDLVKVILLSKSVAYASTSSKMTKETRL